MVRLLLAAAGLSAGLVACAAESSVPPTRVLVTLVHAAESREAVVQRAQQAAGVPVTYATAVSPELHALDLSCGEAARCDEALSRLRADSTYFRAAQRDGMKKKP